MTVDAGATAPSVRWKPAVETCPVCNDGSNLRKALDVALVSLTADGIVPFRMPVRMGLRAVRGLIQ